MAHWPCHMASPHLEGLSLATLPLLSLQTPRNSPGCSLRLECSFPDASLPRFLTFLQSLLKCHLTPTFKGQPPSTQVFAFPLLALFSHVALITVQ